MSSKPRTVGKYFRLIDFHVYDNHPKNNSPHLSDSSVESNPKYISCADIPFTIQMFGLNESGETCCIYINDYKPFFYVKVGDNWNDSTAQLFLEHIKKEPSMKYIKTGILSAKIVEHKALYGFTGGKTFKFVLLTFQNIQSMNKVKNLWYSYDKPIEDEPANEDEKKQEKKNERKLTKYRFMGTTLELYESSIAPILRYFHIQNISPSGWVRINTPKCRLIEEKTTTCTYEYICSLKYVIAAPERETRVPYKICSFDIEASSSHGDFPLPKKTYKRLATNIVDIFQKQIQSGIANTGMLTKLLSKSIHTAFGYATLEDIDCVYPKYHPPKETIERLITHLLTSDIDDPNYTDVADSKANQAALTIERMFEKIKEFTDSGGVEEDADEEMDDSVKPVIRKSVSKTVSKNIKPTKMNNKKKDAVVKKTNTILDMLTNDEYSREEKIDMTNVKLGKTFPPIEGDKVTFIGSTFLRYGESTPYLNHCLALGSCDPVEGAEIQSVEEESDLLTEWTNLIQRENPDIVIGYNIFGIDYEFMFRRAEELSIEEEFFKLSRVKNHLSAKEIVDKETDTTRYEIENTKMAIASGEYDLRYFNMCGRLQIDMYAYFRRDFNLSSYKLDDVAGQYISDDIRKVETANGITRLFSSNLAGLNKDDFIHIEITGFSADYYGDGKKFRVLEIEYGVKVEELVKGNLKQVAYNVIHIEGDHSVLSTKKSIKWGMAKDDVTPQDIFRLANGSSADRAVVAKYCIQDCNLVHHLMNKIDVITGYVEMSRICSVPISYLVFRGQGVKLTSYVAKKCRDKNTLMPDLEKGKGNEGYEGAIVLPPKCGIYMDNPVACVDYSSLYPSSMISQNYSHDSKVWTKEYDLQGILIRETGEKDASGKYIYENLPGYEYIQIEFDTFKWLRNPEKPKSREVKTKVGKKVCCWAQLPEGQKSIMPAILEELLQARSDTRKQAKVETDPFMQNILDKRQLGYKVTANSLYGQCGARTSTFYEKDVAASTTATGRMMITYARRIIEEVYGDRVYETACQGPVKCKAEYIYGDSVANYTQVKVRRNKSAIVMCTIEDLSKVYGNYKWVKCKEEGKQEKEYCELSEIESWTESGWTPLYRVIRHKLASHKKMVRIITDEGSQVDVTDDHSLLNPEGEEISPDICSIGTELLSCKMNHKKGVERIQQIYTIPYEGYVYDLTTENHHFAAGSGNLIVHNTDSVFFTFNLENPETGEKVKGKPALEMTIEIAQDAANLCTKYLKPPMALAYEKTLMPFMLLSKKRYVGMLYEEDPNKGKLKFMGLVLKRRDNCDLVKDVYGGVLDYLMKEDLIGARGFLDKSLQDLIDGKVPMDKLAITKALRGDYKNPQQIAHRVLADRIGKRDPGNKPKSGDRIKYIYIVNPDKNALQGDKIETPDFIIQNKLSIDYTHYITNQLMKPLQQLFGLAIVQILESDKKIPMIRTYHKDMALLEKEYPMDGSETTETFMKKKEKYCSQKIKTILFDKFLQQIFNKQHGIRTLDGFMVKKT